MAVISVTVAIESITVPAGRRPLDPDDLRRRVELELAGLLVREPLRALRVGRIQAPGGQVHAATTATPASVAHAIARRIHTSLQTGEARPR